MLAAALNVEGDDLWVGQTVGRESGTVQKLWDAAQMVWDTTHPQRLCDGSFWPIYGDFDWELNAFDRRVVNIEIANSRPLYQW